jgi:hypothetical protein
MNSVIGNFADNGSSATLTIKKRGLVFLGSAGASNFGGGAVVVEAIGPDGQWYTSGESVDAADVKGLEFDLPVVVRLTLAGATSPDLDYAIQGDADIKE